jgi:hypothetical protein
MRLIRRTRKADGSRTHLQIGRMSRSAWAMTSGCGVMQVRQDLSVDRRGPSAGASTAMSCGDCLENTKSRKNDSQRRVSAHIIHIFLRSGPQLFTSTPGPLALALCTFSTST